MISAYIFGIVDVSKIVAVSTYARALTHMSISAPVTGIINYEVLIAWALKRTQNADRDMLKHTQQWFARGLHMSIISTVLLHFERRKLTFCPSLIIDIEIDTF